MFGRIPAELLRISGRIYPNLAKSRPFWLDPAESMAGSGQIFQPFWPDRPASNHGRILAPAIFQWPDVARFLRRLDSDDGPLPNSDNRISNVRIKTKSLIFGKRFIVFKTVNRFSKN